MTTSPERLTTPPNGGIPNNPALPALIFRAAVEPDEASARAKFRMNGWGGLWTWTVFDYHHWHPGSHEALACIRGWADLHLGGPEGSIVRIDAGDVAVLPAGFGHKRAASGDGFAVVGAYPPGQESPEICRADAMDMAAALDRIGKTPLPGTDPLGTGNVLAAWGATR
ncbi:MAG: cupin [Silicimonas sp.]|nr:cupin [Silicimonas sp.]RZW12458.1 MAG: cupin [Paracoccaceae bacterium]